jgi:outer membrane receptor protein involved in Fe transport
MKKLIQAITFSFLLVLTLTPPLQSEIGGRIAGTITAKATGEPLYGANIAIVGTTRGASTNEIGQYSIIAVPPGMYDVQITYLGYRTVLVSEVRVHINQTARLDVELDVEAIYMDEVTVTAERLTIRPDVATSEVSISRSDIDVLPITNVVSAIGLQAGIRGGWAGAAGGPSAPSFVSNYSRGTVSVQQGPSIRGGSGANVLFIMDGITLRDPRNSEPMTRIPISAVQEISVERGGFNAEYGQVRSGVVNIVTKEGSRDSYHGEFQMRYLPPQPKYWLAAGVKDVHDPMSFALRPFFDDDVAWTGTDNGAWDQYKRSKYPEFVGWNEIARIMNTDNDPTNDVTPQGAQRIFIHEIRKRQINDQPDYNIDAGFGGPVPFIHKQLGDLRFYVTYRGTREMLLFPLTRSDYRDYDVSFRINSDINPDMKLRLSGLIGKQYTMRHNWDATGFDNTGNYFYPRFPTQIAGVISGIGSYHDLLPMFSDFAFSLADISHQSIALKFSHFLSTNTFYEISVDQFRRDYFTRQPGLRDTTQRIEILPGFFVDTNPLGYWPYDTKGVLLPGAGIQFVSRARDNSTVTMTTFKADITSQVNFYNLVKAGLEFVYNDLDFDYGIIESATQDDVYATRVQMRAFPIQAAVYLQDKLELRELTINAGLRLDYINPNINWWDIDEFDVNFLSDRFDEEIEYPKAKAEQQWQLSPRLGISHPITETSKLFFNYGHFKQLPQYETMFRYQRTRTNAISSLGDPNITLARTISYELGFDWIVFNMFLIQLAGYYHDISDQQDFTQYRSPRTGLVYSQSTANNYQDSRGFEITIRRIPGSWWSGFVNYTYEVTTSGHFGSSRIFETRSEQRDWDAATVNSYENRPIPQPYARANLNIITPNNFGPAIAGYHPFGDVNMTTIFDWQAGYWTTWNPHSIPSVAYNVKAVDFYNLYLRLSKAIKIGNMNLDVFVDVNNVLNTLRLWNTGNQSYLESLHLPSSEDYDNIPGDDKVGYYRKPGVAWQPIERSVDFNTTGQPGIIYYQRTTGTYWEFMNGSWREVEQRRMNQIFEDRAYINMPNADTYWFLDPRRVHFGMRLSFNL